MVLQRTLITFFFIVIFFDKFGCSLKLVRLHLGLFVSYFGSSNSFCGFGRLFKKVMSGTWPGLVFDFLGHLREINACIFQQNEDIIHHLLDKIKFQSFWWMKEKCAIFNFDYHMWWLIPILCLEWAM